MAVESKKWVEVIAKLIQLTQAGTLKWQIAPDEFSFTDQHGTSAIFISRYKNKILRISRIRYEVQDPGPSLGLFSTAGKTAYESVFGVKKYPYWTSKVDLEFVDSKGQHLWSFPNTDALEDLYTSVQYQVAGVSEFLDDILKDE